MKFEDCVIALVESLYPSSRRNLQSSETADVYQEDDVIIPTNSTQFCLDHYDETNTELWTDEMSPEFVQFEIRKWYCLSKTGVKLGKNFCNAYKSKLPEWS